MEKRHRDLLRKNRVGLVKDLVCNEELLASLEANNTLTGDMAETVRVEKTRDKQAVTLLNILTRRGPNAFMNFCDALEESGQEFLRELLDADYTLGITASAPPQASQQTQLDMEHSMSQPPTLEDPMAKETASMIINIQSVDISNPVIKSLIERQDVYPMANKPRGRAVIICNTYFTATGLSEREGASYDLDNLSKLFDGLGFTVSKHEDKSAEEIEDILVEESRHSDHQKADAFILFLMTHGTRGSLYGLDGKSVEIESKIAACFDASNCPNLKNKPKMIFIQACQGDDFSRGIPQSDAANEDANETELRENLKGLAIQDDPDSIPNFKGNTHEKSDFIMAYSTVPGYSSWRRADLGSWFVRAICQVFSTYAHEEDVIDMLTKVRKIVLQRKTKVDHYIQVTETRSTLLNKLYFLPGYQK